MWEVHPALVFAFLFYFCFTSFAEKEQNTYLYKNYAVSEAWRVGALAGETPPCCRLRKTDNFA